MNCRTSIMHVIFLYSQHSVMTGGSAKPNTMALHHSKHGHV